MRALIAVEFHLYVFAPGQHTSSYKQLRWFMAESHRVGAFGARPTHEVFWGDKLARDASILVAGAAWLPGPATCCAHAIGAHGMTYTQQHWRAAETGYYPSE